MVTMLRDMRHWKVDCQGPSPQRHWKVSLAASSAGEDSTAPPAGKDLTFPLAGESSTAPPATEISTAPLAAFRKTRVEGGAGVWQIQSGPAVDPSCGGSD